MLLLVLEVELHPKIERFFHQLGGAEVCDGDVQGPQLHYFHLDLKVPLGKFVALIFRLLGLKIILSCEHKRPLAKD